MNKKAKKTLSIIGGIGTLALLASCNSFCSVKDTANFRYAYDPINTTFYESKTIAYEDIVSDFSSSAGISSDSFTLNDLVFVDDNGSIAYSEDKDGFEERLFHTFNENLISLNAGQLNVTITSDDDKSTTYSGYIGLSDFTVSMFTGASSKGYVLPSYSYFNNVDLLTLDLIVNASNEANETSIKSDYSNLTFSNVYGYTSEELVKYNSLTDKTEKKELLTKMNEERAEKSILANYGYLKHYSVTTDEKGNETVDNFARILSWNNDLVKVVGANNVMTSNYITYYKSTLQSKVGSVSSCISVEDGFYGNLNDDPLNNTVKIEGKASSFWSDWGKAFSEHGFLEGLLVYPISVGIENMAHSFGMNGWGQIGAVLLMTLIVRLAFMLITLPTTISQQRMQMLQPEIAKLQQKYPNAQTNQYDKQRLAQATQALYKKNKINPFSTLLILVVQFPLFISVWNAMRGSASLTTDSVLGLKLSDTIWGVLSNFSGWPSNPGWWTALCLILLMSAGQIMTIILPNIINKKKTKNVSKMVNSDTANSQAKQMKYMQWFMIIMIIVMGFNLPSAMGVYWFAGSIFSILQTLIINLIMSKKKGK